MITSIPVLENRPFVPGINVPDSRLEEPNLLVPGKKPVGPTKADHAVSPYGARPIAIYPFAHNTRDAANSNNGVADNLAYNGKHAVFNGSSTKVTVPHHPAYSVDRFCIIGRMRMDQALTTGQVQYIINKRTSGSVGFVCYVTYKASNMCTVNFWVNGTSNAYDMSNGWIGLGFWFCAIYDNTQASESELYIGDISRGTVSITGSPSTTENLMVGRYLHSDDFYWLGNFEYLGFFDLTNTAHANKFAFYRNVQCDPYQFLIPA